MCGGKGLLNVFEALENNVPSASASSTVKSTAAVANANAAATSNAALKNRALFGMGF
jgi:hypothetical protein